MEFLKKYSWAGIILLVILTRLFFVSSKIENPHSWRQCDTHEYIRNFHEDGIDLLHPKVNWMGGHEVLALEFPLPEAIVAMAYKFTGENIIVAKLIFLLFFLLSVYFLYRSLCYVFDEKLAGLATLIYAVTPLSFFYSIAVHIDFFAVMCAHGMLFYFLKALHDEKKKYFFLSSLFAIAGFMVKAPYLFYFVLPMLYWAFKKDQIIFVIKNSLGYAMAVIGLYFWNKHTAQTNASIPNWSFIPNFNKFTDMSYWYFGTWDQRQYTILWNRVLDRLFFEILGYTGTVLMTLGLIIGKWTRQKWFAFLWLLGALIYWFIFFNLNIVHNYYQIPFIAPFAIFMAAGLIWLGGIVQKKWIQIGVVILVLFTLFFENLYYVSTNYFETKEDFYSIANAIHQTTEKEDIVVISHGGLTPQCPILLHYSDRHGFSIPIHDISPELLVQLHDSAQVNRMALVYQGELQGEMRNFYDAMPEQEMTILKDLGLRVYSCKIEINHP